MHYDVWNSQNIDLAHIIKEKNKSSANKLFSLPEDLKHQ